MSSETIGTYISTLAGAVHHLLHCHAFVLCRVFRQKQFEEERMKEFQLALEREAVSKLTEMYHVLVVL